MEINTSDATFEKDVVEKSKKISVIVEFWAPWCGPCLVLGPILEKIINSKEYKDKIVLAKLNTEENTKKSSEYSIMSIPSVKLFKNGEIINEFVGLKPESEIREWVDSNI